MEVNVSLLMMYQERNKNQKTVATSSPDTREANANLLCFGQANQRSQGQFVVEGCMHQPTTAP